MSKSKSPNIEARDKREDELIAKYHDLYMVMRTQVIYARGNSRPKDEFVIPMLEAVDELFKTRSLEKAWTRSLYESEANSWIKLEGDKI